MKAINIALALICGALTGSNCALVIGVRALNADIERLQHDVAWDCADLVATALERDARLTTVEKRLDDLHSEISQELRLDAAEKQQLRNNLTAQQKRLDDFGQWAKELAAYLKSREGCR